MQPGAHAAACADDDDVVIAMDFTSTALLSPFLHIGWMMAAMMAGFFLLGLLSERLYHARKISPVTVGVSAMAVFIVLQLLMALGWTTQPMLLMTAFSFFATAGILPYAGLSQIFPNSVCRVICLTACLLVAWNSCLLYTSPSPRDRG